jgi:hypothetical protein
MNDAFSILELHPEDTALVADLTARGMRDNPLDIAAFGPNVALRERRMRKLFRVALPMTLKKGVLLGASDGATLVGIAANLSSAECQPSPAQKVRLAPRLFLAGIDRIRPLAPLDASLGRTRSPGNSLASGSGGGRRTHAEERGRQRASRRILCPPRP